MNPIYGIKSFWRLFGECEPLNSLYSCSKGLSYGPYAPKFDKNYIKICLFGTFRAFPLYESLKLTLFLVLGCSGDFWKSISH